MKLSGPKSWKTWIALHGVMLSAALVFSRAQADLSSSPQSIMSQWVLPLLTSWLEVGAQGSTRLLLWNWQFGPGVPFPAVAFAGHVLFHPVTVVMGILRASPSACLLVLTAVHFYLAYLGVYLLARKFGQPRIVALLAGLLYAGMIQAQGVGLAFGLGLVTLASLFPWSCLALSALVSQPESADLKLWLLAVAVGGLASVVAGPAGLLVLAGTTVVHSASSTTLQALRFRLLTLVFWLIICLGLAGVTAVPQLEFLILSGPVTNSSVSSPRLALTGLLFPSLADSRSTLLVPYFSLLILLLVARSMTTKWSFRSSAFFLLRLGVAGALAWLVWWGVARIPVGRAGALALGTALMILSLHVSLAVARELYGLLRSGRRSGSFVAGVLLGCAALLALAGVLTYLFLRGPISSERQMQSSVVRAQPALVAQKLNLSGSEHVLRRQSLVSLIMRQAILLALLSGVLFASRSVSSLRQSFVAIIALALLDLRFAASLPEPRQGNAIPTALLHELKGAPHERVLWLASDSFQKTTLLHNAYVGVFNFLPERLSLGFARAANAHPILNPEASRRLSSATQWLYLSASGVRWVIGCDASQAPLPTGSPDLQTGGYRLYSLGSSSRRVQTWQRASRILNPHQGVALTLAREWPGDEIYVEGAPAEMLPKLPRGAPLGSSRIEWDLGNDLAISFSVPTTSTLVLADQHYPGWHAWIGEQPVPLLRANGWMRCVVVPPGADLVRMVYLPASYRFGGFLTVVSLVLVFLSAASPRWRIGGRRREKGRQALLNP